MENEVCLAPFQHIAQSGWFTLLTAICDSLSDVDANDNNEHVVVHLSLSESDQFAAFRKLDAHICRFSYVSTVPDIISAFVALAVTGINNESLADSFTILVQRPHKNRNEKLVAMRRP